jgi:DNA-binding GntR family transcriptional regulator
MGVPAASEESVPEAGGRSAFTQAPMPAGEGGQGWEGPGTGTGMGPVVRGLSDDREPPRPAIAVLADRIAASLVHHEPGWRLPRHTALARRYNVSTAEIDAAVDELSTRHLVRRLPDGQLYRVSPAEYLIPIEGVPGLDSRADPMGGQLACRSRQVSWRRVPEDIGWVLRIPPAEPVGVIRVHWTANGEPAAFCTTYLLREMAGPFIGSQGAGGAPAAAPLPITAPPVSPDPGHGNPAPLGQAGAVHIEMQPPPPSVARSLRLSAGQPAALVTVRFDDPREGRPVALTVGVFRPDLFRIVVESGDHLLAGGGDRSFSGAWTHAAEDWEP